MLGEGKSYSDPLFLNEVLSLREDLSEADDPIELNAISEKVKEKYKSCVQELSKNFKNADFESAKQNTIYLQYYTKILEEIENLLGEPILDQINIKPKAEQE